MIEGVLHNYVVRPLLVCYRLSLQIKSGIMHIMVGLTWVAGKVGVAIIALRTRTGHDFHWMIG